MGFSSGSGSSSGWGYGYNAAQAASNQAVWGPQASALTGMYGGAQGLANRQAGQVGGAANRLIGKTMPGAMAGFNTMQAYADPSSTQSKAYAASLADTVGQEFNRTILPGIRGGAGIGGNMGGSREALAKGVAASDAQNQITQGLMANSLSAAGQLPAMAGQVFNLGMTPFQAQWAPYQSLASILGGPTTLTQSASQAVGENWQQQMSKQRNFGFQLW